MASQEFQIHVEGLREVEAQMGALFERTGDLTPLMITLGDLLIDGTKMRFDVGAGPDGTPWKPSLRAELEGGQTLVDSERLRDTLRSAPGSDHVEVGSDLIYAAVHQMGATIRPVNAAALRFSLPGGLGIVHAKEVIIPARPYLGVSEEDETEITSAVAVYAGALQ